MFTRLNHAILAQRRSSIRGCIYTFIAGPRQRVKLEFDQFQLADSSESCESEYVDVYSELKTPNDDLLSASFGGRYCGSVSPYVRISLNRVIVLVLHSRASSNRQNQLKFQGRYAFISDAQYIVGQQISQRKCDFLIYSKNRSQGTILSPTYPGTYPKNFHCTYLLNGNPGQRIRLYFRDFDVYFGGEHCPYDSLTIYDGPTKQDPIITKICGLQQRLDMYTLGPSAFIEFNSSNPTKADPRGYMIEYKFSDQYVDVLELIDSQKGVTHLRGTECDIRIESNRETTHYIKSPRFPKLYPPSTACTYIIDGLQGEQNLEKVVLTFEKFSIASEAYQNPVQHVNKEDSCDASYVGIISKIATVNSFLGAGETSFDSVLCDQTVNDSVVPFVSDGPRMILYFASFERVTGHKLGPYGFFAKIEFKTDFGIAGQPDGDSNKCSFIFTSHQGFFNSPRYPANYPLDTNCTYTIRAKPGQQILVYFEQFALYNGERTSSADRCADFVEIVDVFDQNGKEVTNLKARYCPNTFPGPTVTAFGSHELRFFFKSDSEGTGNGFKALYIIRKAFDEEIPTRVTARHCGGKVLATPASTSGWIISPGYPAKYNKNLICDWEVTVRNGYKILLTVVQMEVEGTMNEDLTDCQNAVIRVNMERITKSGSDMKEICGTVESAVEPIISKSNVVRLSFLTSPKVNGLKGFNLTWTEVNFIEDGMDEKCMGPSQYLCTYTKFCISSRLRCDGDMNCGLHDDTDEAHCNRLEKATDIRTVLFAAAFSGVIFIFIFSFLCYLFKKKLGRKEEKRRRLASSGTRYLREPYRLHKPVAKPSSKNTNDPHSLPSPAASRLTHYDMTGAVLRTKSPITSTYITNQHSKNSQILHQDDCNKTFYG